MAVRIFQDLKRKSLNDFYSKRFAKKILHNYLTYFLQYLIFYIIYLMWFDK